MAHKAGRETGDTLVEVLMSVVVLSIVIIGAITLMSRGLVSAQLAVEHTQVRQFINSQTEMIRYLRDAYLADADGTSGQVWVSMFSGSNPYVNTTLSQYNTDNCNITSGKRAFYLEQSGSTVVVRNFNSSLLPTAAAEPGRGLWIEARRSSGITPAFVDFQIRACWSGVGTLSEQQTVTSVRLYDPAH